MVKKVEMDEKVARIKGFDTRRNPVEFEISFREVKHIRRCTQMYLRTHPRLDSDIAKEEESLSQKICGKFAKFGKGKRRQSSKTMKKKMKGKKYVCSEKGCNINQNLEIDHIRPLSADGTNDGDNLRWFCHWHHRIREIGAMLRRKELEVKKLKEEREELKKQTCNKNKAKEVK